MCVYMCTYNAMSQNPVGTLHCFQLPGADGGTRCHLRVLHALPEDARHRHGSLPAWGCRGQDQERPLSRLQRALCWGVHEAYGYSFLKGDEVRTEIKCTWIPSVSVLQLEVSVSSRLPTAVAWEL